MDDGSNQDVAWRNQGFDDSSWAIGDSPLGYGDGDEETIVSFGGDPNDKHITTYFRSTFEVPNPASIDLLFLKTVFDDGTAVYLNGTEVYRANLGTELDYQSLATGTQTDLEDTWFEFSVDPLLLNPGANQLSAEVHLADRASPDMSFDLQVVATLRTIGDMDCDGDVDFDDIDEFVLGLSEPEISLACHPKPMGMWTRTATWTSTI